MYSSVGATCARRSDKFLLWFGCQIALTYWVIYHPNLSVAFLIATIALPMVYHHQPRTWRQHWVVFTKRHDPRVTFLPPGIGHRWIWLLPKLSQLKYPMCLLLPSLLWMDRMDRVLLLTWSVYVSLCPLHPTGLFQLPQYLFIKPKHLTFQNYLVIWDSVFYNQSLPFRS